MIHLGSGIRTFSNGFLVIDVSGGLQSHINNLHKNNT